MSSTDFENFYKKFHDTSFGSVRDGLDLDVLTKLTSKEKERIEEILIDSLGTSLDISSRPVIALGFLKSKKAAEYLKRRLITSSGSDKLETALALYRIERFPESEKIIIDALIDSPKLSQWDRMIAVHALGEMDKTRNILETLIKILEDEDTLIVSGATRALKKLVGDNEKTVLIINEIILLNSGHRILTVEEKTYKEKVLELKDMILANSS